MPTPKSAIIIGTGIGGPLCALALYRKQIPVRLYESRSSPETLGGAINLNPNAVRILAKFDLLPKLLSLGCSVTKLQFFSAHSGAALGTISFGSIEQYGFESLRVCRSDLQRVLLEAVAEKGIEVRYNKKLVGVEEDAVDGEHITAVFSDGSKETADLLIGADGIHSAVRRSFVNPGCDATYSGICSAYGFASWDKVAKEGIEFDTTALAVGRKGSFLMSFCNPEKTRVFWAVVMAVAEGEVPEREDAGWRVRDEGRTKSEIVTRFDDSEKWRETVRTAVMAEDETFFFPVNELPAEGRWWRGRCVLIGDAAHAMPPQGQSIGLAFEDAVILARVLGEMKDEATVEERLRRYDELRRPRVAAARKEAAKSRESLKEVHWFVQWCREWLYWFFLAVFAKHSETAFMYDVEKEEV